MRIPYTHLGGTAFTVGLIVSGLNVESATAAWVFFVGATVVGILTWRSPRPSSPAATPVTAQMTVRASMMEVTEAMSEIDLFKAGKLQLDNAERAVLRECYDAVDPVKHPGTPKARAALVAMRLLKWLGDQWTDVPTYYALPEDVRLIIRQKPSFIEPLPDSRSYMERFVAGDLGLTTTEKDMLAVAFYRGKLDTRSTPTGQNSHPGVLVLVQRGLLEGGTSSLIGPSGMESTYHLPLSVRDAIHNNPSLVE